MSVNIRFSAPSTKHAVFSGLLIFFLALFLPLDAGACGGDCPPMAVLLTADDEHAKILDVHVPHVGHDRIIALDGPPFDDFRVAGTGSYAEAIGRPALPAYTYMLDIRHGLDYHLKEVWFHEYSLV